MAIIRKGNRKMAQAAKQITEDNIMQFPEKSPYKPENALPLMDMAETFLSDRADEADWLRELRQDSLRILRVQGLPTPKLERFKYTNFGPAAKNVDGVQSESPFVIEGPNGLATIYDAPADELKSALSQEFYMEDTYRDFALWHLNTALMQHICVIDVPANKIYEEPLRITYKLEDGKLCCPRVLIRVGQGAELTVIESLDGGDRGWLNGLTSVEVGANARLNHYRTRALADDVVYSQHTPVTIERDARYEAFALVSGSGLGRNQIHARLIGQNADCSLFGINMLDGKIESDTTITIEHEAPHCTSNQFYRSVLKDRAHGIFQGKVHVHQPAQKTDGYQLSNALVLSEGAQMDTKPELEIYADDVRCSHGATCGQLNEDQLFYLRARGLPLKEAQALLIEAFVHEATEKLNKPFLNEIIEGTVTSWLSQ